jgi:hypothetical protein
VCIPNLVENAAFWFFTMQAGFGAHQFNYLHPDWPMSTLHKPNFQTRWPATQSKPPISLFFFLRFLRVGSGHSFSVHPRVKHTKYEFITYNYLSKLFFLWIIIWLNYNGPIETMICIRAYNYISLLKYRSANRDIWLLWKSFG